MREYKIVYGSKSCKLSRQKNPVVLQEIRYESETTPISVFEGGTSTDHKSGTCPYIKIEHILGRGACVRRPQNSAVLFRHALFCFCRAN